MSNQAPHSAQRAKLEQAAHTGHDAARIELGNQLLSEHRYGTAEHERGLELLKLAAEGPHGVHAQWFLGAYFAQVPVRPNAHAQAAQWLERAAGAGFAPAMDRLSDFHLLGAGIERSPERAIQLQSRLAGHGFQPATWQLGYLLAQGAAGDPDPHAAAIAFARAAALGYPPGYYSLGLRFAQGAGVPFDGAFARALLLRAADGRFPDAREAADELVPASTFGAAAGEWHSRLKANMDAAPMERLAAGDAPVDDTISPVVRELEAHFARVGHPALHLDEEQRLTCMPGGEASLQANPHEWEWVSKSPRVGLSRRFATREECAHLTHKMAESLREASQYRRSSSANDDAEVLHFSGRGQPVGAMQSDAVVRLLERRIADMTHWATDALEPCSVIRYRSGEEYRPHVDFFSAEQIALNDAEGRDFGGQRIATFLLYLKVPESGGETVYEKTGLVVRGERGMGVLHYNVTPDGNADEMSLHTGRPVEQGEKWLWRSTLRAHCLYRAEQA